MSLEILDTLEARVREAVTAVEGLRERNAELADRVAELEAAASASTDDGAAEWQAERAELERRISQLVERLESLLAD